MYKPPKGIKYGIVSKEAYNEAMDGDARLSEIIRKRTAALEKVAAAKEEVRERKLVHKKSFWSLWRAEGKLTREKMREKEASAKLKAAWQKRCWEIFKILRVRILRGKK